MDIEQFKVVETLIFISLKYISSPKMTREFNKCAWNENNCQCGKCSLNVTNLIGENHYLDNNFTIKEI